jgi:hypothetical protein
MCGADLIMCQKTTPLGNLNNEFISKNDKKNIKVVIM